MKNQIQILSVLLMTFLAGSLFAQNGNAVISEVKVYDLGNGTGLVDVRVSGNQAYLATHGSIQLTGADRLGMGMLFVNNQGNQPGNNDVILSGTFILPPSFGNGSDFVEMDIQIRSGNSLLTKSKEKDSFKIFRYR